MEDTNIPAEQPTEIFENIRILDEMKHSYLNYSMSVIVSRALPDIRDGLKPSQRRILVAMNDLNLGPRSKHRKCAKIVGDTGGNYHPHGDQATYGTLVRLGQQWNLRYTLVHPQGNFGSIDADPPAAMRYTEARMASPATELLDDLNKDTVDFVANYDETRMEPTVLPGKLPNLLINGATGIAVGMATNLAPHNLGEVCDAILYTIDNPECSFKELIKIMPGPDFPTGGTICGKKGILDAYTTGKGHLTVRAKTEIETTKRGRIRIVITEIPYQVIKTTIVTKIADCVHNAIIPEISDVRDESDRKGMRVVVELKKDADEDVVLNKLFRYTSLQTTFAISNIALVNSRPETLTIKQMIEFYLKHRKEVIRRRTRFLLKKARNRAHILEGLILAVSDIDEIIELIKKSPDAPTAKLNLMKKALRMVESQTLRNLLPDAFVDSRTTQDYFLTGPQADAILTMQLQRLTGLEIAKLAKEYSALIEEITGYEAILNNENLVLDIIREDIHELKAKYSDKRRTVIADAIEDLDIEDLIADENVVVTISHAGYVKKMPLDTYRKQGRGGRGIIGSDTKEDDFIEHLFIASTHDYLMIFTDRGKCYWLKVYNVPSMSRQSKGRNIANLVQLSKDEKMRSIINVRNFDERNLVMATKNGIIKKTVLSQYGRPRANGVIAIKLDESDNLIGVEITSGQDDVILGTSSGMAIRFNETQARPLGRASRGVKGIKLRNGDEVVDMVIAKDDTSLLTVCENGFGKRTALEDYRTQSRGGLGLINIKCSDRNGKVVALKSVLDDDEIMLVTINGIIMRTGLEQLRTIGRNTQGVKIMRLDADDKFIAVGVIGKSDEEVADENAEATDVTADTNADAKVETQEKQNDDEQ